MLILTTLILLGIYFYLGKDEPSLIIKHLMKADPVTKFTGSALYCLIFCCLVMSDVLGAVTAGVLLYDRCINNRSLL